MYYYAHVIINDLGISKKKENEEITNDNEISETYGTQTINKELADEALRKLEGNKNKSKEMIEKFIGEIIMNVEKTEKEIISKLDNQRKKATEEISGMIASLQKSQILSAFTRKGHEKKLKDNYVFYEVRDNSVFLFEVLNKYINKGINCTSLEPFFVSLSHSEVSETVKTMKESIFSCRIKMLIITIFILF